jgi:hypothetical protein
VAGNTAALQYTPVASGTRRFDLSAEADEEKKGERASAGPFVAIYAGMGVVFAILGGLGLLGVDDGFVGLAGAVTFLIGLVIAGLGLFAIKRMGTGMASVLVVSDDGVAFTRRNGKSVELRWDDPHFKLDLAYFSGDATKVLPKGDARAIRPYWVDVWTRQGRSISLETTLPDDAVKSILERAASKQVRTSHTLVAYYWQSAPKSPGWLAFDDENKLQQGHVPNGERWLIRGSLTAGMQ